MIWRVTSTNDNGNITSSVTTWGSDGATDSAATWLQANSLAAPMHSDGTTSRFRLRIGASALSSTGVWVEWSDDAILLPRLDSNLTTASRGSVLTLDGLFPIDQFAVTVDIRFHNLSTNLWYQGYPQLSYTATRTYVSVPSTLPSGTYNVYVRNNGQLGNPATIVIN